jgi:hypothetical protein
MQGLDAWRVDSPSKGALWASFASLADPLSGRPERGWKMALAVLDWRRCKVWMHGGLTHPPRESFGPALLRSLTLFPAGRKEGGRWHWR